MAGGPDGGGGRPGTGDFCPAGEPRDDPGIGGAPVGGFDLAAAVPPTPDKAAAAAAPAAAAAAAAPPPGTGSGRPDFGEVISVGLFMPAPTRRSLEMGAGRFGGGFWSSPPLMKAPRA